MAETKERIYGIEAVTKDEPARCVLKGGGQKNGVGLDESFRKDGTFELWMGDGTRTLTLNITKDEVSKFALAMWAFAMGGLEGLNDDT
jgi:hypothetical protein